MKSLQLNCLLLLLLLTFSYLQYQLWFSAHGVRHFMALKQTIAQQAKEKERLQKQNAELTFEVKRLKQSKDVSEEHARNELGMIKNGETFYQVIK